MEPIATDSAVLICGNIGTGVITSPQVVSVENIVSIASSCSAQHSILINKGENFSWKSSCLPVLLFLIC
jgi:hypothetical protein